MSRIYIFIVSVFLSVINVYGTTDIGSADSAYNNGNYNYAASIYENIIQQDGISASLLYNLGNCYMQMDDYGRAMLNYQRARKLDPSNKLINENILYLQQKVEDANKSEQRGKRLNIEEDDPNFFQAIHKTIAINHTSNTWAAWAVVCFILFIACVAFYIYSKRVAVRKIGFFGGFVLLGLSILFVVFSYMSAKAYDTHDYGVVLAYKVELIAAPNESGLKSDDPIVTKGTKVKVLATETDAEGNVTWYKVRLNSDYIGWIKSQDLEII